MKIISAVVIGLVLLCVAATNVAPGPFDAVTNSPIIHTNVPVHVLPVVQESEDTLSQYLVMIIPVVVPLLITGLKKFLPNVPSWALPLLAPVIGALADGVMQAAGVHTGGLVKGALLGSAGVGLRELQNQVAQAIPKPPAPVAVPVQPPQPPVANPQPPK